MELLIAAASGLVLGAVATFLAADDLGGWKQRAAHLLQPEQRRRLAITLAAGIGIALYAWWLFGLGRDYATFLLLAGYLLAITPGDMREKTISNRVTALFAVVFVVWQLLPMDFYNLLDAAAGGLCGLVLMGLPYLVRRDSVGTGGHRCRGSMRHMPWGNRRHESVAAGVYSYRGHQHRAPDCA